MSKPLPFEPEALSPGLLQSLFGTATYQRGLGYFRQGRSRIVETGRHPTGEVVLQAVTRGSGGRVYEQWVTLATGSRGPSVHGTCSCPMAFDCKHVVAVSLAWQAEVRLAGPSQDGFERWLARYKGGDAPAEGASGEALLYLLISLKAGGTGLNLTEADTVIHYDPWWNPAVETQASDRAHRIGQDKPVFVYKLITEGTVEERILALQERKRELTRQVYGGGRKAGELPLDAETIEALLAGP